MDISVCEARLLANGYEKIVLADAGYRAFWGSDVSGERLIVLGKDLHNGMQDFFQIDKLLHNLKTQYGIKDAIFLFFTDDVENARNNFAGLDGFWIYNLNAQQLIIYEGQPESFWGLEIMINTAEPKSQGRGFSIITVTNILVVINIIVFVVMSTKGNTESAQFLYDSGGVTVNSLTEKHEYYRLFLSMFIHSGIMHIINNMLVLYMLGSSVEKLCGRIKFTLIYMASGLLGGAISMYYYYTQNELMTVCVGASGAIFGLIGALIWILIRNKGRAEGFTLRRMILYVIMSVYLGITDSGVSLSAHLAGLAVGFVMAILLYRKEMNR